MPTSRNLYQPGTVNYQETRRSVVCNLPALPAQDLLQQVTHPLKCLPSLMLIILLGSPTLTATARKEIILSAGSVGTAQILQLSGIGNATELKALGINTIVQNTDVGENLSDHTLLPNLFSVQGDQSFDHILRSSSQTQAVLEQWIQNKTGLFANNVINNFGFARLPSNSTIFKTTKDPAAGPKSPHFEMIFSNFYFNPGFSTPATGSFMTCVTVLISPTSRKLFP